MAQDPLGDAQQQPWYPQPQPEWQGGYPEQQQWQGTAEYATDAGYGTAPGYGTDAGYGGNGYGQGGYGHGGHPDGPYQPYAPYPGHEQQQYAPYAVPQPPAGDELYAPAGAEYSADGYVHIEPEPDPEPAPQPGPAAPSEAAVPGASARPGSRSAGRRAGGSAGRSSFTAKARAAADAVVSAEHAPGRRALMVRTGAGVAALGVLVAAGLAVAAEGSENASADGDPGFAVSHAKAWSAQPAGAVQPGADDTLVGSWLLADAVVRADSSGVHAYDLAAGRPTWSVEPPAAGAVPCGLSPSVNGAGLGAVLFRPKADPKSPCTLVAAVDAKTGKTAWTKSVSDAKGGYAARIGVTEDKVIAVGDDRVIAWESADGKDVWQYTGQGKFCTLSGGVTGRTVMVASSCADSTPVDQAVSLNTADGKVNWWRGLNSQPKTVTVLSAEPSVVLATGGKPDDDKVLAWGPTGDPAAEIPVATGEGRLDVAQGTFSATPRVFFQDRTMVTTVVPANGGGPVSVVGYDLDSGKPRWKTAALEKGVLRAVAIDDRALVLAADERRERPAHLSRFTLDGGGEAMGGSFPQGTGSLLVSGRVLIGGGKVVAVPEHSANFGIASGYQATG
ncbi:PQQ-binding-like beta-propeller repeat protein [Kitasatospora sp. NPDC088548]|uniref:outer membrane protein assembly factor BamB family protein n=1 Tax=Kitasatospora sp. NPDC088548 TaxID=3364075 RepID=UPI00381E5BCC